MGVVGPVGAYARNMADLLVVDDDEDVAETIADILKLEGHSVRVAYDGQEGLSAIEVRTPDLVLLDIEMPVMDGVGMAYEMLLHNLGQEKIPILVLSGTAELQLAAKRIGTPYFLGKPYKLEKFLDMLNLALTERKAPTWAT